MKEFIIANEKREDICILDNKCSLDIDVGKDNDFQLTVPMAIYDPAIFKEGHMIYCIGTELGGILGDMEVNTSDNTVVFTGDTPRGMLSKKVIEPHSGQDYRTFGQPLGTLASTLFYLYPFDDVLKAVADTTTPIVSDKYDRYVTVLDGLTKILNKNDYKLAVRAEYDTDNKVVWLVYTEHIHDFSDDIEISQDCNIDFKIKVKKNLYTHMICGGTGELKNRMIIHLYLQPDGSITEKPYYTGVKDRVYWYDYSSIEGDTEEAKKRNLKEAGIKQFEEINKSDSQNMMFDGLETLGVNIGDIVGGREYTTGITIKEPITSMIYKYQYETETTEIKVGENNG